MSGPQRFTKGRLVRGLAFDQKVRILVVVADGPAREMCRRHGLQGMAALLASEGLVSAALLSSQVKGEERISVEIQGETPRFSFAADVWGEGQLRARFRPERLPGEPGPTWSGYLSAIRSLQGRTLYRGVAQIEDERFEQALSRFLTSSEQVDGRVRLQAGLDEEGEIWLAAGMLVERFPDMDPAEFAALLDGPMAGDFHALMTGFAFGELAGSPVEVMEARDLEFRCTCSPQRVHGMLRSLGAQELASMIEEDGGAEVTCHFCGEVVQVSRDELTGILEGLGGAQME